MTLGIEVKTSYSADGIVSEVFWTGSPLDRISHQVADLREEGVRAALVELGWTPPANLEVGGSKQLTDTARLDWLERMTVNVRVPLRYGSKDLFWASPDLEEEVSDLRAQIDAAAKAAS